MITITFLMFAAYILLDIISKKNAIKNGVGRHPEYHPRMENALRPRSFAHMQDIVKNAVRSISMQN
jgi:hypothetical protein